MATDDERREVARRLRELASENKGTIGSMRKMQEVVTQAQKITGTMLLPSVAHVLERYADLIDPHERTCRSDREAVELLEYCYALECALVDAAPPDMRGHAVEVVYALRDMFAPTVGRDMPSWEGRA